MKMTPRDQDHLCQAIIDVIADYDPSPEDAAAVLEDAKGEWRAVCENRAEAQWIDRQRFDSALARKLKGLADMDAARALK